MCQFSGGYQETPRPRESGPDNKLVVEQTAAIGDPAHYCPDKCRFRRAMSSADQPWTSVTSTQASM